MDTIKSNKAACMNCLDVLESTHRHDFKTCNCFRFWDKVIRIIDDPMIIWNCPESTVNQEKQRLIKFAARGIIVDGGKDYLRRGGFSLHDIVELSTYEKEPKRLLSSKKVRNNRKRVQPKIKGSKGGVLDMSKPTKNNKAKRGSSTYKGLPKTKSRTKTK